MPIKIVCFLLEPWVNTAGNQLGTVFLGIMEKFSSRPSPSLTFAVFHRKAPFLASELIREENPPSTRSELRSKLGSGLLSDWKRDKSCFRALQTLISYRKWNINIRVDLGVCQHCEMILKSGTAESLWTRRDFNWSSGQVREEKYFNQDFCCKTKARWKMFEDQTSIISFFAENCFSQEFDQKFCRIPVRTSWHALRSSPKFHPRDIFYLLCCRINLYPSWILRLSSIVVV